MSKPANSRIRLFGNLHSLRRERGLPSVAEIWLPREGRTALQVAAELDLPVSRIEGVFCSHRAFSLEKMLKPGDEIGFIPSVVPGPHRSMLGVHAAGKGQRQE